MRGRGSAARKEYIRCPSLYVLSRISKEDTVHHLRQLDSPSQFPTLSLGPHASYPSVTLEALLQEPVAFCLHLCIICHVT